MTQLRVETTGSIQQEEWNTWISKAGWGTIFQTTFWADRLTELRDCAPYFITVSEDERRPILKLLGFDVRSDKIRQENEHLFSRLKSSAPSIRRPRRFQWFGEPALINSDAGDEAYRFVFAALEDFCRTKGINAVGPSEIPAFANASLPDRWQKTEWATLIVDLHQSEQALWNNLKKSARKAIRDAQQNGLTVRRINSLEDLRVYYDFACECARRYGKKMYGFLDFETMWRHFRTKAVFETFVAEKSNVPIAGLSVWGYNGIIAELGSFQSERGFAEKLYGSDLIKWEVLRWGSEQGYRAFDLAGISPEPQDAKERGIRQFKEKWGGQLKTYYAVSCRVSGI